MRIIGGELRGRRIGAPRGRGTRPLLDRVREALFATLVPWLSGARILDLFAGSGSLGLEALSRGAASARFVERDPRAVAQLRANVARLGLAARVEVVVADALEAASWGGPASADVVFLDPPYALLEEPADRGRVLAAAARLVADALRPQGVLVLHAPRGVVGEDELLGEAVSRRYGTNELWYVQRPEDAGEEVP